MHDLTILRAGRHPIELFLRWSQSPPKWTEEQRTDACIQLGFRPGEFVITTFGHIVWTKWGDRLFEAFLQSTLCDDKRVHLVFAGELPKDDFGQKLKNAIESSRMKDRVHITGFLSMRDFERYLRVTDLAVQLRTKSRGGTPKGVLDCMAYGVPVVVNNDASYTDYPDDVILEAQPSRPSKKLGKHLKYCMQALRSGRLMQMRVSVTYKIIMIRQFVPLPMPQQSMNLSNAIVRP